MSNYFENQDKWSWQISDKVVLVTTDHGDYTHTMEVTNVPIGDMVDHTGQVMGDAHQLPMTLKRIASRRTVQKTSQQRILLITTDLTAENPVSEWIVEKVHHPFVVFQDPKTGKMIGINKDLLSCGFITIAEPGGGKTNLLNMVTAMLLETQDENDKIIIFDTKGDYFREFGSRIPKENFIVIGAGSEYRDITAYHNIFAEIMPRGNDGKLVYTEDADEYALETAKQLYANMQSVTQPIFPSMAEQIIAGMLVYFMRTYWLTDPSKLNNKEFSDFAAGSTNDEFKAVFDLAYMKDFRNCVD